MANLADIRRCLADGLDDCLDGRVTVYANVPQSATAPFVIVRPGAMNRVTMQRGVESYTFELIVGAALSDSEQAQDVLDSMLSTGTERSVIDPFDLTPQPFRFVGHDFDVSGWNDYDSREIAGTEYLTASLLVTVLAPGRN